MDYIGVVEPDALNDLTGAEDQDGDQPMLQQGKSSLIESALFRPKGSFEENLPLRRFHPYLKRRVFVTKQVLLMIGYQ
jgi:hypothetical protein